MFSHEPWFGKVSAIYTSAVTLSLKGIDWRSFLARPALPSPSPQILEQIFRQPVLITGAGGSIGSALALRLAHFATCGLVLLEAAENNLGSLERAWIEEMQINPGAAPAPAFILGDAGSAAVLEALFVKHRPRLVFHTAANKHVPLLEQQPFAAIANNIFATEAVVAAAAGHGARVVLLSTDKAVKPASVMGATKRAAEQIVLRQGGTVLRLANVLASSGSVAEVFAAQIERGGPLTVTHPAARRYFLTMEEAVNLLLIAAAHEARPAVLVPALQTAHGITELAGFMARTLAAENEFPIQYIGLRPGDKLSELLWDDSEIASPAGSGDLLCIRSPETAPIQLESGLAELHAAFRERNLGAALDSLCALVPSYSPGREVLALVHQGGERVCA